MKETMLKSTRAISYIALGFWCIWALVFVLRVLRYAGIINFDIYMGVDVMPITWQENPDESIGVWVELVGYITSSIVTLLLSFLFIRKTLRALSSGEVFTLVNVKALRLMVPSVFFYALFCDNLQCLYGIMHIAINSTPFVAAMLTLIMAMLYNLAYYAQEENRLTI